LNDFVKIVSGPQLIPAAANQPAIEGSLQNRLQTIGQGTDSEGITYKIAATVVDVLPNGTLVLEARKFVRSNQDYFEYRLTGRVDKGKVKPDRTARTEDIAELKIERIQRGKIFDSTKVNWGTRILDIIWPF
jgi:flagellar L-ring protein precursor FlgH